MILLKNEQNKVKSYIYCANQILRENCHKKWNQECKQKQTFVLLTSRTQKIAWWPPVYRPGFFIFSYNEQEILKKFHRQVFIVSNLKLHCYLAKFYLDHLGFWRNNQKYSLQFTVMSMMNFQILRFLDSSKATQKSKCYEQEPYFSQIKHSFIMH